MGIAVFFRELGMAEDPAAPDWEDGTAGITEDDSGAGRNDLLSIKFHCMPLQSELP